MAKHNLDPVFLVAPTSPDSRLKMIAEKSRGFVYAVSRTGVTGMRQEVAGDTRELVSRVRKFTKLPVAVGFGVSNAEQFAEVGRFADAAVVGSAIMQRVFDNPGNEAEAVKAFIRGLTSATKPAAARRG
jgi:tryptophan synthase alpha chain